MRLELGMVWLNRLSLFHRLEWTVVFFMTIANICLASQVNAADRPNVVVILTDDQGTLDARCFGAEDLHTPNIDRLASTGVRFTQAYAHMVCCPTRAALLTGRYPQRGGINMWTQGDLKQTERGVNMSLSEVTLAEALRDAGYRTALFGKWHLGAASDSGPTCQGFERFFGHRGGFIDNFNHHFLHGKGFHDLYEGTREVFKPGEFFPDLMMEQALTFLNENREQPFFLYLALNTPHYPEQPPEKFFKMYENLQEPRRTYAAFVSMTDANIGRVLDELESLGLRDDTIVVFQSDNGHSIEDYQITVDDSQSGLPKGHNYGANGGGGYTGPWIGNKATFLEGGIRVPAAMSYPRKLPQGVVRDQPVMVMDWYPTVLELCGVQPPEVTLDGHSVLPLIRSAEAESEHKVLYFQWFNQWAVREGDWKLICHQGRDVEAEPKYTLHNLKENQPEVQDHFDQQPEIVERLKSLHAAWAQDVGVSPPNAESLQNIPELKLP